MSSVTSKQAFDYEIIAMAHHEAGHTVMSLHNYFFVYSVQIMTEKTKHRGGSTEFFFYDASDLKDEEIDKVINIFDIQAAYAGLVAEKIYYKDICGSDKFPMHLREGSSLDMEAAAKIVRKNNLAKPGKETFLLKKQVQKDIFNILTEHWPEVKLIAHYLYKKKKLTFDDLKFVLTRKSENKQFWKDKFKKIQFIFNENKEPDFDMVKNIFIEDAIYSI